MVFTLLIGWKKIKRIFHGTWKLCKIKISVSINKALLKHSHTHSFTILLWLLSCFKDRVEHLWQSLDGLLWVNYFLSSPFIEKVYWPLVLKKSSSRCTRISYHFRFPEHQIHILPLCDHVYYRHYGEGNGTPLQYSCLENPMGGGAW